MPTLFAGTSGYAYPAWKPGFYPQKLAAKGFLEHYATRLNSVEINYTFRQLPKTATLESWVACTPANFTFTLKAHMRLTHILRLANAAEFTEVFLRAIDPLRTARRIGPILYQLPPNLKRSDALLDEFLALLPRDMKHAFEFRNTSWLADPVYDILKKHGVALCLAESDRLETPQVLTADFVYSRLRKPDYSAADIQEIAAQTRQLLAGGRDVYVYFKHEETPDGALNAETLLKSVTLTS